MTLKQTITQKIILFKVIFKLRSADISKFHQIEIEV